jgi:ABC-type transport system involved in cytochrome c biogenesis ATPase subunit
VYGKGEHPVPLKQDNRSGHLNIRISPTGRWILDELQDLLGLSQSSIIEMLLRQEARDRGVTIPGSGTDTQQRKEQQKVLADEIARYTAAMTKDKK